MKENDSKIGLGGGCHWCTEAVFQQLKGVTKVEQGYISSAGEENWLSEAIIVHFDQKIVSFFDLIRIHLHTHAATSQHSFRHKYRSAIYYFEEKDKNDLENIIESLQHDFEKKIITQILPFNSFKASRESLLNYYENNKNNQFCERYIIPKVELLERDFSDIMKPNKSENPFIK
ncbi:MAG: peptide-methionine (S)-S-oxide reductase [Leeuwenhoekiella sp.]